MEKLIESFGVLGEGKKKIQEKFLIFDGLIFGECEEYIQ